MAYAAVFSLMQKLEYSLKFSYMILRIKKFQMEMFNLKVSQLDSKLNSCCCSTDWRRQFMEDALLEAHSAELESGSFILTSLPDTAYILVAIIIRSMLDIYHRPPEFLGRKNRITSLLEMLKISEETYLTEAELDKSFDRMQTICTTVSGRISSNDSQKNDPDLMSKLQMLCHASDKLKTETTFFYKNTMQIKSLCQDLAFLLAFLKDSANICKNHGGVKCLEKCISNMADRAEDVVEEKLLGASLESKLRNIAKEGIDLSHISALVQTSIGKIFDKEHGIIPGLYSTFEEIDSIKRKVTTFYDETLDIRNLLSHSDSNNGSTDGLIKEDIVVCLDNITEEIVDRLTGQPSGLEILTITGMGGIGKTTLARKVFEHPFTVYHFYCRAWITISQVYQVRDLLQGLLCSITQPTDEMYEKNKEQLAESLYRSLKGRRYLIVIDDIWSIKAWEDVKKSFPNDRNGSRILLTSRLKSVAISISPKWPSYCISPLGVDESAELLQKKVFGKESCPQELIDVGNQIVKQCQGLPLSIVVVAGHLSRIRRTQECWKDFANNVSSIIITDPEQCLEILSLSYNHLPHHLKACYLYMGAFPEDCDIEVEKLINLWIAEGFLDLKSSKRLEEVGEDYLEDLINRSLVLVGKRSFNGKIKTCCLHDILRELCLREAKKEKFMHVIKWDSQSILADMNNERRLSFHIDFYGDIQLMPSIPLVRSFLCFSVGVSFTPDIFFLHLPFKLLRVLDISFLRFDNFPTQILNLVLLKYLALTVTYKLPAQLSELGNLRTLIIHGPWTVNKHGQSPILSFEYWSMPWLRYLHIGVPSILRYPSIDKSSIDSSRGYSLPFEETQIVFTINLQTLSRIQIGSCTRQILGVMPYLKKLGISESKEDYIADSSLYCLGNLVYLEQLETLKCSFYKFNTVTRHKLCWNIFPSTIKQLSLSWSYLPWEDMTSIAMLPNLEVLKLKNYAFRGPEWAPTEDGFHHLRYLLIEKTDLKCWKATRIHFLILKRLVLRACDFLEEIPFSIGEIPTLELIELHYCSKSAELSAAEIKEEIEGVDVRIQSKEHAESPLKGALTRSK